MLKKFNAAEGEVQLVSYEANHQGLIQSFNDRFDGLTLSETSAIYEHLESLWNNELLFSGCK